MSIRRRVATVRHVGALLLASAMLISPATAQRGMGGGGMRGGGMGGRGGGMGGRGGGMGGGGGRKSPADMAKKNLKESDQITFYLKEKKPLALTHVQRDTLKSLQKDMHHMQDPLFKDMDKLADDMMGGRGRREGRGQGRGGGGGGGMGGGGRNGGRGGNGDPGAGGDDQGGVGGRRGGVPDTLRTLVARLTDIQDAYRDRARAQLTAPQRVKADSLFSAKLAEDRKKDEAEREKRRRR